MYCSDNIAPSINQLIKFIDLNNMNVLQISWSDELKPYPKEYYFNSITHHLFITPYLIDSVYLKEIEYLENIDSILNVIGYLIDGIWYTDNGKFNLKNIDPVKYLNICNKIIELYQSDIVKTIININLIHSKYLLKN